MPMTCYFYKELHTILGGDHTILGGDYTTKSAMDTSGGLEAAASGVNPEDEVVDEEVELEEDVGHVTRSSSGVASQGLFSTPEGSSQSQHSDSGAHEAREASSASADVPLRTKPYILAEHLCQKRRRTRRSKEAMFRKVLQSIDAAHSETRAWRETINEKLRLDSLERRHGLDQMIDGQTWMIKLLEGLRCSSPS